MIKKTFILFCFIFCYCTSFCQLKDGLYHLKSYNFQYSEEGLTSYIIIKKDRFVLFSLKKSPNSGEPNFQLHFFGTGNFSIKKNSFVLHLNNENNNLLLPFIDDSVDCSFSTDSLKKFTTIKLIVHPQKDLPGGEASLEIETSQKNYWYNTKNYTVIAQLPANTIINSIKLFLITYDYRVLPYDYHFNNFEYNYYLNDSNIIIRYADKGEFEFKIKSKRSDGFIFESNGSLLKTDDRAVSSLKKQAVHDKNLRRIVEFIEKK